jgi:hypothetical protein
MTSNISWGRAGLLGRWGISMHPISHEPPLFEEPVGISIAIEIYACSQEGRPDCKEHRLTEAGREELSAWLPSPLTEEPSREPFLARVFFSGSEQNPDLVRRLINARRLAAREQLESLTAIKTSRVARRTGCGRQVRLSGLRL